MKILYVANIHRHFNAFHVPYIKWLRENGHEVHVAANGEEVVEGVNRQFDINIQRSPYRFENINAYKQLKEIIEREKYDIVHCHTPMGGILGRLASKNSRKKETKVIYTCHGFHFCKGGPIKNWILYYPVEKFMAKYTDIIITINNEDYQVVNKFNIKKKYYIPGIGLDISKFKDNDQEYDFRNKRAEIGVKGNETLIISVGDLTKRKNHQIVIQALANLRELKFKYVICGKGVEEANLKSLAKKMNIEDKVVFLGHRTDIKEILRVSDIFVFPSLWEGLGIAGIEAMAAGIPVIASDRHGIKDYAIHDKTALLCDPRNSKDFYESINTILTDKYLRNRLVMNASELINKFDISNAMGQMIKIYEEEI
ncbi:glycosyltransferase family 4 protein [Niameybacter massiliensis]|uniref:Glycosyltransferase family 4 protein n=1 Tax=Holtiella tumoricola TaxID=3018743 RepID=A0AA42J2G7_9FIRM|nr:glycosyltransferase family 4 protein [Holtiella tumoricola]MDA3733173.1 glycosyltransferase family 4 protein [Holtiella tumoricola]